MKKVMKKLLSVVVVIVVLLAMAFTVPDEQSHRDALKDVMGKVASQVLQEKGAGANKILKAVGLGNEEKVQRGYDKAGKAMAPTLVKMVHVNDYLLFTVGKLDYEGTLYPVSLGMFGHVFILPLDKITAALSESEK